jgi:GH24 family phage-related lysozyme (muramidase)
MNQPTWITYADPLIRSSEATCLTAYPDSRSPLGIALVARHGANILLKIGAGKAVVDADLAAKSGSPWTIGIGQTGKDIGPKTIWSLQHAESRFQQTLQMTFAQACAVWPGLDKLHPKAQAAFVSMVYNRGLSLAKLEKDTKDRRREMRDLRGAVYQRDYLEMARLFRSMKRLWENTGQGGLLTRREEEAVLCEHAALETHPKRS